MNLDLGNTQLIIDVCREQKCHRNQAAHILATAYWKTARTMEPVVEAYWMSESWRQRNLRYYPWHGRGFIQITWEVNYRMASDKLGIDFIENPEAVLEVANSAKILVRGSMEGWFTNKKIADYITINNSNFIGARNVISGSDKAKRIAKIAKVYDLDLKQSGYGVGKSTSTVNSDNNTLNYHKIAGSFAVIIALLAAVWTPLRLKIKNTFNRLR